MSEEKVLGILQFDGKYSDHWSELMENMFKAK